MSNTENKDTRSIFEKASEFCQERPVTTHLVAGAVSATAGSLAAAAIAKKMAAKKAGEGAANAIFGGRGFFK